MAEKLETLYLDTINLLKELNLWDLESGLAFLPIIQYCMPPPSTAKIIQLLTDLKTCQVDTDWAPLKKTTILLDRLKGKPLIERGDPKRYGTLYPVQNGIHRIAIQVDWTLKDKAFLINHFASIVFHTTAEQRQLHKTKYYNDVYRLRDALIATYARSNNLNYTRIYFQNIEEKINETYFISKQERLLGTKLGIYSPTPNNTFWTNPPEAKFTIPLELINSDERKKYTINTRHQEKSGYERQPTSEELLLNNTQQEDSPYFFQPRWARNNVRSLADMNQLSWSSIFAYWEYTLKAKKYNLFILSFLTLLTGIKKSRWLNAIYNPAEELTFDNLYISETNTISFKVNQAATRFSDDHREAYDYVTLQLPAGISLDKMSVKNGLKEEGTVRGFSQNHSGPAPFLNNISRAGHTLFRKNIAGESLSFILAGNTPIEFKARSAYHQAGNAEVNESFVSSLSEVKKAFKKHGSRYRLVREQLDKITFLKSPLSANHAIGSQLANVNWDLSTFNIAPYKQQSLTGRVLVLNQLELYYFWMLEYAYATRPLGASTEHMSEAGFVLHRDKDSSEYMEAKLLIASDLVKEQKEQLIECRQSVLSTHQDPSLYKDMTNHSSPLFHTLIKNSKYVVPKLLLSDTASKLTEKHWGITPVLNRNNAHRHQCATYIHKELGETYADTWLGHHIDGWYFSSPQSTSTISILKKVAEAQDKWLDKIGFHLIRNPLR